MKHQPISPFPMKRRYCTHISCEGQTFPERTDGRTSTAGSICTIPSMKWWSCFIAAGRKRSTLCENCSMRGWWRLRNKAVENPTAFTRFSTKAVSITEWLKYGCGTPDVWKSYLRSTKFNLQEVRKPDGI